MLNCCALIKLVYDYPRAWIAWKQSELTGRMARLAGHWKDEIQALAGEGPDAGGKLISVLEGKALPAKKSVPPSDRAAP
jgi:hypothetical protein